MKTLVTVKRTPHRDAGICLRDDGKGLELEDVQYEINPFDELAIEEALRLRDAHGGEVIVVSIAPESARQQLIAGLAMGADRALRVDAEPEELDPLGVAAVLAAVVERESPDLILCGKLAIDDEAGQVPGMLAARLDWPLANQASSLEVRDGGNTVEVVCEVDEGLEHVELDLPAIVTADLRLNEPRYVSLPGIMKAKKKPSEVIPLAELRATAPSRRRLTAYRELPAKPAGVVVESVEQLVAELEKKKLL